MRTTAPCIVFALVLLSGRLAAQDSRAATIQGILDVADLEVPRSVRGDTDRVRVNRSGAGTWFAGRKGMALFRLDQVLVEPRTIVRLALHAGDARGDLHFAANLEDVGGAFVLDRIGGNERTLWEIRDVPRELGDVEIFLARGALALDWFRGRLIVLAARMRTEVSRTRVVVNASEDGQRAIVHVVDGEVTFPDFPGISVAAGQFALLEAGLAPIVQLASPAMSGRIAESVQWSTKDAWPRPFYTRPWVWVGAGAGAVAVGQLVRMARGDRDGGGHSGVVIVQVPF